MLIMILKMAGVTLLYVVLTVLIWKWMGTRKMTWWHRLLIGLIYGGCSVLSTHFAIDYSQMLLNVRDLGPLTAGMFFDPVSGIIAGLIGGVERYIAGTYWNIGSYTRIACSASTCLAGFVAAALRIWLFKHKKPSGTYAFILGAVMEVFHMYVVLITHRDDMNMALYVVKTCSGPMILFTGLGMAANSTVLRMMTGEWQNPFRRVSRDRVPVSRRFQFWLFIVTISLLLCNTFLIYMLQTQAAIQDGRDTVSFSIFAIKKTYMEDPSEIEGDSAAFMVGRDGTYDIIKDRKTVLKGAHEKMYLTAEDRKMILEAPENEFFTESFYGISCLCRMEPLNEHISIMAMLPYDEIYSARDAQVYENAFEAILLFAAVYTLISELVQLIVVNNLSLVNASLAKITGGDLDEVVSVRESSEFTSLSDDINQTVDTLKGYITAAEKRIEQELEFARTIQDSALPKNFKFPREDFEIYAVMDPAKEVGGDFYDFFFVGPNRLAMVIADVSGKGVPAALFMMRAKTGIRGMAESGRQPADILRRANDVLCEGNDAEMFVTVWLGILDLKTGEVKCANAGHEYPAVKRAGGGYELIKDKHGLALAAMEGMRYTEYTLQLNPGDRLFVYTDGIPEAINGETEQYGTDRMIRVLDRFGENTLKEALTAVREDVSAFVGGEDQFDDITMLNVAYFGPEKALEGMGKLIVEAKAENLEKVFAFVDEQLEKSECTPKARNELLMAAEEIFINIASYAYSPDVGSAWINASVKDGAITIEFRDRGYPFDPLAKRDPDVTLSAEKRQVGGLGIFMVKKTMDEVSYRRENGENILTIRKKLS